MTDQQPDRDQDSSAERPKTASKRSRRNRAKGSGRASSHRPAQQNERNRGSKTSTSGKGGPNGTASSGKGRNRSSQNDRRNRSRRQHHIEDGASFWGDPSKLPDARTDVRMTAHPAAIPRSLGPPPLADHESVAEHYFEAIYDRAVTTAGALAAAGGLIDPDALEE